MITCDILVLDLVLCGSEQISSFGLVPQTNLQFNNNKYYLIQLLKDDSSKLYSVWLRWGRGEFTLH